MNQNECHKWMQIALDLAKRGEGHVEPNPMVGCILVKDGTVVGQGFHQKFGEAHAEVNAIESSDNPKGATAYVTLEPCCHCGKTGPCTEALIEAGVARAVVAMEDPFPEVAGKGIEKLIKAGIEIDYGTLNEDAEELNRPYIKRITEGMPWVIAKWAMTLDGKIATASGSSKWISNEQSRAIVHQLRGRVDAVIVGAGTALADDPMLTARPAGARVPMRIVVDSLAKIGLHSKLIATASEYPTAIAVGPDAASEKCELLQKAGAQVFRLTQADYQLRFNELLKKLGEMNFTNVLVEGGSTLLGTLHDGRMIDEVHCFIAPKIAGGDAGFVPVAGKGISTIDNAMCVRNTVVEQIGTDTYVSGRF